MPFATTPDGLRLHYAIDDHTDPWREAPWLLLQHGYGRHGGFWYRHIPYLSRWFRIIRPDMRGFGQSREGFEPGAAFDMTRLAEDVLTVLDHAGIARAHYCGEAFGGTLGMLLAARHGARIRTLSLLSAPVFLHQDVQRNYALGDESWTEALRRRGVQAWVEQTNGIARFPPEIGQGFLDWYSTELARSTDAQTLIRFSELCGSYDQRHLLPDIAQPVLAVFPATREEQVALLRAHLRDLRVVRLATRFFMIYQIAPRACAEAVLHFCAQHDGFSPSE
jgi:3-oxoadipate enol-lactonase